MIGLTRDGTAKPVSRDQILRRERGHGKNISPAQLTTSRIGNFTRLILALAVCGAHTKRDYERRWNSIIIRIYALRRRTGVRSEVVKSEDTTSSGCLPENK